MADGTDDPERAAHDAAETVRRHLVRLRGGAPFLSASDGAQLVRWLDDGVPLHRILQGLEKAAASRIRRRVRAPLTLGHARRHLRAPAPTRLASKPAPVAASPDGAILQPVADALRASPLASEHPEAVAACARDLLSMPSGDPDSATRALDRLGRLWDTCWRALDEQGRAPYHRIASERLGDLLEGSDEGERAMLLETWGRAILREQAPGCGADDVLDLLDVA